MRRDVNHLRERGAVRWVRRAAVAAVLAAPVVVVLVVAWPSGSDGGGAGHGPLAAGDEVSARLGFGEVARFPLEGDGGLRIRVRGEPPVDATLTVVDDDGRQLAYNDDTNGLDPEVTVDLGDGDGDRTVEVRELGGNPGAFTITVEAVE